MLNYTSPEYEPSGAVKYFEGVPRYGHTENFYEVIEGNRSDYIRGILLIPALIAAITILWFTILAFSTCICRKSYLSGRGLRRGEGAIVKGVFLFSTSVVIISSILFLTKGGTVFTDTFDDIEGSKVDLFQVTNEGVNTLAKIRISLGMFIEKSQILQDNIAGGVCQDLSQESQNLLENISTTIFTSDYTDQLDQLNVFEHNLRETFSSGRQSQIEELLEKVERIIDVLKYGALPSLIITSTLVCGLVFKWRGIKFKVFSFVLSFLILPLFVLIELLSGVIVALLGIILLIFSDLCTGGEDQSPEGSIISILDTMEHEKIMRQSLDHYIVDGCRTENPFGGLTDAKDALADISMQLNEAADVISEFFETKCSNFTEFNTLLAGCNDDLIDLNDALQEGLNSTECEKINSIFVTAIHEGACRSAPNAIWWMFGCCFAVWIGGLFMLATRAACLSVAYQELKFSGTDRTSSSSD